MLPTCTKDSVKNDSPFVASSFRAAADAMGSMLDWTNLLSPTRCSRVTLRSHRTGKPTMFDLVLFGLDGPSGSATACLRKISSDPLTHCTSHAAIICFRSCSGTSPCFKALWCGAKHRQYKGRAHRGGGASKQGQVRPVGSRSKRQNMLCKLQLTPMNPRSLSIIDRCSKRPFRGTHRSSRIPASWKPSIHASDHT